MRNLPPDKYNVAWFKLAECVSRGEKERALGVYRLLAHSLHDAAFARQLQGDILISFNDIPGALDHYKTAARLYQQDGRLLEAAALYEHIVTLVSDKRDALLELVELYRLMGNGARVAHHATTVCALMLAQQEIGEAMALLDQLQSSVDIQSMLSVRQQVVLAALTSGPLATDLIMPHIVGVLDALVQCDDTQALQRFVSSLETLDEACYEQACAYMAGRC